ncbi:MAG: hypothetical protein QM734_02935 [Cyclobacteriaceae bacterium]
MYTIYKSKSRDLDYVLRNKSEVLMSCLIAASVGCVVHETQLFNPEYIPPANYDKNRFSHEQLYDTLTVIDTEFFLKHRLFPSSVVVTNLRSKNFRNEIIESIRRLKAYPSKNDDRNIVKAERKFLMAYAKGRYYRPKPKSGLVELF